MRAMEREDGTASIRQDHNDHNGEDHDSRRDGDASKSSTEHDASHTHKHACGKENGAARVKPVEAPTTTKRPRGTTIKLGPGSYTLQPRLQVLHEAHACMSLFVCTCTFFFSFLSVFLERRVHGNVLCATVDKISQSAFAVSLNLETAIAKLLLSCMLWIMSHFQRCTRITHKLKPSPDVVNDSWTSCVCVCVCVCVCPYMYHTHDVCVCMYYLYVLADSN
jgi:hypothetical protein